MNVHSQQLIACPPPSSAWLHAVTFDLAENLNCGAKIDLVKDSKDLEKWREPESRP